MYGAILQEKVSEIEVTKGEIRAKDLELKVLRNRVNKNSSSILMTTPHERLLYLMWFVNHFNTNTG